MATMLARTNGEALQVAAVERLILKGDLSGLSDGQITDYTLKLCERYDLDPLSQPFEVLVLSGKKVLYARKSCAEQLRLKRGVSITDIQTAQVGDVYVVTVKAQDKTGRVDVGTGAVAIVNLRADALANALMKAETKAKRRVTLSICGLGMLDESELETIPGAQPNGSGEVRKVQRKSETTNAVPVAAETLTISPEDMAAADQLFTENTPPSRQDAPQAPAVTQRKGCITEKQRKRLWAIAKEKGIDAEQLRQVVASHGFEHGDEITLFAYDAIVKEIQG